MSERKHHYGSFFHWVGDPFHDRLLARFCSEDATQPEVGRLAVSLTRALLNSAVNRCFPTVREQVRTRMATVHKEAVFEAELLDSKVKAVVVDLMRAGIVPSQICFEDLHSILSPKNIRQDHILLNRKTGAKGEVIGTEISGHKIGGGVDEAFVFIADPMGATGGTLCSVLEIYENLAKLNPTWSGMPRKFVALHFIVTPEYLKRVEPYKNRLEVFALRVDRGLSTPRALQSAPGEYWSEERGLNDKQYIVPGAGGIGEILNNSFV